MAVNVETLEKLERKITLELPVAEIQQEVEARLKRLSRQVKMDGFRPGKVPLSVVAKQYGYSVQYEVANDKVGQPSRSPPPKPSCASPALRISEEAPLKAAWPSKPSSRSTGSQDQRPDCRRKSSVRPKSTGCHRPHPRHPAQAAQIVATNAGWRRSWRPRHDRL